MPAPQNRSLELGKTILRRTGFIAVLIMIWQAIVWAGFMPDYLFPGPLPVAKSFGDMWEEGLLWSSIRSSLLRMIIGYSISVVIGLAIGAAAARSKIFKETFGSLALALQSIPSVCWLPLALIWVGINEQAVLVIVVLGAVFAIAVSTESAFRNIPPIYPRVGQVLGARGWVFSRDILFWAALPEILSGLKLGWTFAWRSLMAAELIRQDMLGVGRLLETGRQFNDPAMMLAAMAIILAMGLLIDRALFGTLETVVRRRWGLASAS